MCSSDLNVAIGKPGGGGSGGQDGKSSAVVVDGGPKVPTKTVYTTQGGFPGGGAGGMFGGRGGGGGGLGYRNNIPVVPGQTYLMVVGKGGTSTSGDYTSQGANGAIRVIWPGDTRSFPETNTGVVVAPVIERGWGVDLNAKGQLVGYAAPGPRMTGTRNVADGQWHHFALVRYGSRDLRLYVDGKLDAKIGRAHV